MDTKALRQKILDLAIRGKLVPQDPNDEPASVLLERIRAEKQQMVKEGKLKAKDIKNDTVIFKGDDNLHYEKFPDGSVKCIEEEIPFELPQGWEWSRFSSAFIINPRNNLPDDTEVSFVPMSLIQEGYANNHTFEKKTWSTVKSGFTHFAENDIGVAKITPCFENKKSVVFGNLTNGFGAGTTELHIIRSINDSICPEYVLWFIKTDSFISNGVNAFSGAVGQKRIGKDFVEKYLIPIAPTSEQKRIVERISTAFKFIDDIDASKEAFKLDVEIIKSKILDLAIRGKLVPQDPNDEPASVLLERIRAEKEELIKQGKIKRDKKESVIFKGEDNSYYDDIPENWCISCLSEITSPLHLNDGDWILSDNMVPFGEIKLIQLGSVGFLQYNDKGFKYLSNEMFKELNCTEIFSGYMLINRIISDKMCSCILPEIDGKKITTVDTCWVAPNDKWYNLKYLMYAISSPHFQSLVMMYSSGTTRRRISKLNLVKLPLAFPPLPEQARIVKAIETAFAQLDEISNSIA